jgi:hypothetical protein
MCFGLDRSFAYYPLFKTSLTYFALPYEGFYVSIIFSSCLEIGNGLVDTDSCFGNWEESFEKVS